MNEEWKRFRPVLYARSAPTLAPFIHHQVLIYIYVCIFIENYVINQESFFGSIEFFHMGSWIAHALRVFTLLKSV